MIALLLAISLVFPHSISAGIASWYADPGARQGSFYAAMPGYRYGHPFYVWVRPYNRSTPRIRVLVQDSCGCPGGRVIDLSWRLFSQFAPLSRGLTKVVIER